MKLNEIRANIDKIDRELLVLLQERMGLALRTKKFKTSVTDTRREQDILARIDRMSRDLVERTFTRQLMQTIIEESKRLQGKDRPLVAFQGEHGAFSEMAARRLVPDGAYLPCPEFTDVFREVETGNLDIGVVPVENSLEGAVTPVNDLLTKTPLHVTGEAIITVNHCLLAPASTRMEDIRVVYSHPQALAQCRHFLARHQMEPYPYYDTAGAAKMLARENPHATAAIASRLCADLYDLTVLKEGIADGPANSTRFLLISPRPCTARGDKTSVIFVTPHRAGRLYAALGLFADAGINLTRIASMPLRSDPGNYCFFLDFEGSGQDADVQEVLKKMAAMTVTLKNLGSYPADTRQSAGPAAAG